MSGARLGRAMRPATAIGAGLTVAALLVAGCGGGGASNDDHASGPIKVGVLTDLTGPFAVVGKNNLAVARFTVDEINASGGLLGRRLQIVVGDSASDPAVGAQVARKLVSQDHVDVVIGGVTSNTREAVQGIIAGRGGTTYIWPASYEGGECTAHVWSVGAVPNQQVDPLVTDLLQRGAKTFYLAGSDYAYPRGILDRVRQDVEAGGGTVTGEDFVPIDATDTAELQTKIIANDPDVVFEVVVVPAAVPFVRGLVEGGYGGTIASTLIDQAAAKIIGPDAQGIVSAQDYFPTATDPFTAKEVAAFDQAYPDQAAEFSSTFNGPAWYRGLYLWKQAVDEAGTTDADALEKTMDHASYTRLIGGPASIVPGTRHAALTMYLGQVRSDDSIRVTEDLGQIAPEQCGH